MLTLPVQLGSTSRILYFRVAAPSTGLETTLAFNSSGITAKYVREGSAAVAITLVTQTVSGAWTSGGLADCGGGLIRLDVPDAAFASSGSPKQVVIWVYGLTDKFAIDLEVPLVSYDPHTAPTTAQIGQAVWDALATASVVSGSMGVIVKALPGSVWDELTASHTTAGTLGKTLGALPGSVWDQATSGHVSAGTFGLAVTSGSAPTVDAIRLAVWNTKIDTINNLSANKVMQMMQTYVGAARVTANALTGETMTMASSNFSIAATFTKSLASDGVTVIYDRAQPSFANLTDAI